MIIDFHFIHLRNLEPMNQMQRLYFVAFNQETMICSHKLLDKNLLGLDCYSKEIFVVGQNVFYF